MRPRTLFRLALAMLIVSPITIQADEFDIFDQGSTGQAFEVSDRQPDSKVKQAQALEPPLESYPDPVVDQPHPTTDRGGTTLGSSNEGVPPSQRAFDPWPTEYDEAIPGDATGSFDWDNNLNDCFDGCYDDLGCRTCGTQPGAFINLWASGGYTFNANNPASGFNTPLTFNDFSNHYLLNQIYLSAGRAIDKCSGGWDIGGQVDLLYGSDYFFTTAAGLETRRDGAPHWNSDDGPRTRNGFNYATYGLAMPQLFGEIFMPFGTGVSVKFGHFYTPMGYESVQAPENFFYSHSYQLQYGGPITHTGVLTDVAMGSHLNWLFGYTRGWNNWEDPNGKPNYLTGFTWCPSQIASLAFIVSTGSEDLAGQNNRTYYNLIYTRRMGALTYVFENGFGTEAGAEFDANFNPQTAKWYGINQYFFMDVSPTLTAGMRVEWFRDQDNSRVLAIPFESAVSGGNYVGLTMGFNWRPRSNVIFRPEIRYDYSDVVPFGFGSTGMFDDFTERDQLTLAVDFIVKF